MRNLVRKSPVTLNTLSASMEVGRTAFIDGLSSLIHVYLLLLLGMLEDSAMKLAKSVVICRVEGYGGLA